VTCARRAPDKPVEAAGRTARFLPVDVREPEAIGGFFERVRSDYGRLDTLVNNAGGTPFRMLDEGGAEHHSRVLELNLLAPLTASLAAYQVMRRQSGGGS
jgi:NAD(P)-dependent dehydrogenase (short-subunit alcohol dehydrogenase family)